MRVRVLRRHIEKGEVCDDGKCPAALALRELGLRGVSVGDEIRFTRGNKRFFVNSPRELVDFIADFDELLPVNPITFSLDLSKRAPVDN